jgi:hypothetical protein
VEDWTDVAVAVLGGAAVLVTLVWLFASRIDRMHRRLDRSWDTLALQLTRRASVAEHLSLVGFWDPVTSLAVGMAAQAALEAPPDAAEQSELSAALRTALGDRAAIEAAAANPDQAAYLAELWSVWYRAQLARRFYNEAVGLAVTLRSRLVVRAFFLAGRTPMPVTCDIDDTAPDGLERGVGGPG